jgi:hypothetical protein
VERTWWEYYWNCLKHFGSDCWSSKGGILGLASTFIVAGVTCFVKVSRDTSAGDALRDSVLVGLVIFWLFTTAHMARAPWRSRNGNVKARFGFVGIAMAVYLAYGVSWLAYDKWVPKKHRAAISMQYPDYPSIANILATFHNLKSVSPDKKCLLRITAPEENREVLSALRTFAQYFCEIEPPLDTAAPTDDILRDSVDDFIVVHMAKETASAESSPRESVIMTELGNVFAVKRTYQMPLGSQPGLIWLQIGRGFPYKYKD